MFGQCILVIWNARIYCKRSLDVIAMESTSATMENATYEEVDVQSSMPVFKIIFTFILAVIMFGMGCAVEHRKLIENLKRPVGVAVGLGCQIVLMPTITYALIKISGMSTIQAMAFMLVGCSPGGSNSNVITYLIKGDMSLSVTITTCSNVLALGTIPIVLLIFTSVENTGDSMTIPYWTLAITSVAIAVPIALGIAFRYKFPKHSMIIPKACVVIAIVMLIATITSMLLVTKIPFIFSIHTILPVSLLPLIGLAFSYGISFIPQLQLSAGAKKAVAVETAMQNVGLSNSVIMLTFGDRIHLLGQAITIPLLYNIAQTVYILIAVASYRIWVCRKPRDTTANKIELQSLQDDVTDCQDKEPFNPSARVHGKE